MSAKAECTWGDGPDVLVIVDHEDEEAQGFNLAANVPGKSSSFGQSARAARRLAAQLLVAAEQAEGYDRSYEEYACDEQKKACEELMAQVRALPEMTTGERQLQALDFAYGNLAASTNHKPRKSAFKSLALSKGWSEARFEAWAAKREWW